MAVLVSSNTKAIVQNITGSQGTFHTRLMLAYGTKIVGGVTPGKGGTQVEGVPVFDTIAEAVSKTDANAAIIFVPAPFARDAVLEAVSHELNPIVVITEGIPIRDSIDMMARAKERGCVIIGPHTPGIITPDECKLGIMPAHVFKKGEVGLAARSGTLTGGRGRLLRHSLTPLLPARRPTKPSTACSGTRPRKPINGSSIASPRWRRREACRGHRSRWPGCCTSR